MTDAPQLRLVTTGAEKAVGYKTTRRIEDIRGLKTVKRNLIEIIDAVRNRSDEQRDWPGGVLLYGPSGCGKVFSVEVIAGELDATMYLFDVAAGWDRKQFEQTVQEAIDSEPGQIKVLHFENVDSPAAEGLRTEALLQMLDGAENTVITASATFPWQAGAQLVQQGRIDRVLLVLPPDPPSRALFIIERLHGRAEISDDDIDWIVEHTDGYSFTDIQSLLEVALEGSEDSRIERSELRIARRDTPPTSAQWLSQAGHHAMMSKEGGMYDDLLQYFQIRHQRH